MKGVSTVSYTHLDVYKRQMQEWLRYIVEHNIPVYNVYMQCYYIGNVGRKMIIMDRTRRLRMNATLRDMVRENYVRVDELIYPVFVTEENDVIQEVPSMPGICPVSYTHLDVYKRQVQGSSS